jgi:hypothetical protein
LETLKAITLWHQIIDIHPFWKQNIRPNLTVLRLNSSLIVLVKGGL